MAAENPIVLALANRVRSGGGAPLLTWYRPQTGARTELSVKTFANWVDKTANLIDTLGVEGTVAGPISLSRPGHWMSLLWPLAAWQRGLAYRAGLPEPGDELVVVGPESPHPEPAAITIACSLHPLALGLSELPDGVLDFTAEALAEPDAHWATGVDPAAAAWVDADHRLDHAAIALVEPEAGRVLVRPATAWDTLVRAVLAPIRGGGSAVVVEGPVDAAELARLAAAERVTGSVA